jgi:hypothetical protein
LKTSSMTVEGLKAIFDWVALILGFLTIVAGVGILITGNILNKQQAVQLRAFDKNLADTKNELEKQKERTVEAELALETFRAQQSNPRMIILSDRDGDHAERSRLASEVKKFSGTRVFIQALPDFEPRALASAIAVELANEYGWQVEMIDPEKSLIPSTLLAPGVKVITLEESGMELGDPGTAKVRMPAPAKSKSYPAAVALVNLLDLDLGEPYGPDYFGVHWEAEYDDPRFRSYTHWGFALPGGTVLILVGEKPITGAVEIHKTKTP